MRYKHSERPKCTKKCMGTGQSVQFSLVFIHFFRHLNSHFTQPTLILGFYKGWCDHINVFDWLGLGLRLVNALSGLSFYHDWGQIIPSWRPTCLCFVICSFHIFLPFDLFLSACQQTLQKIVTTDVFKTDTMLSYP